MKNMIFIIELILQIMDDCLGQRMEKQQEVQAMAVL